MAYENMSKDELERIHLIRSLDEAGKIAYGGTVTTTGPVAVVTPSTGKSIRVYWVYALTDPDEPTSPLITIRLGNVVLYSVYALSHTEIFTGAKDATVSVILSEAASVAVTIHYKEV